MGSMRGPDIESSCDLGIIVHTYTIPLTVISEAKRGEAKVVNPG